MAYRHSKTYPDYGGQLCQRWCGVVAHTINCRNKSATCVHYTTALQSIRGMGFPHIASFYTYWQMSHRFLDQSKSGEKKLTIIYLNIHLNVQKWWKIAHFTAAHFRSASTWNTQNHSWLSASQCIGNGPTIFWRKKQCEVSTKLNNLALVSTIGSLNKIVET